MPVNVPVPDRSAGDVFTETMWDAYIKDNVNKLLDRGHRVLTVAQFLALTGLEDGDEAYVEVDGSAGVQWHLRYHATSTKWRYIGGPPLASEIATQESTSSSSYTALATAGPSVAVPLAGTYDVEQEFATVGDGVATAAMSYDIGATAAVDADASWGANGASGVNGILQPTPMSVGRTRRKTLTAVTLVSKYRVPVGSSTPFRNRRLAVLPIQVGA